MARKFDPGNRRRLLSDERHAQAVLALAAIAPGFLFGRLLCALIAARCSSELFRIPLVIDRSTYLAAAAVVALASAVSMALVRLRAGRLDLVEALKSRE